MKRDRITVLASAAVLVLMFLCPILVAGPKKQELILVSYNIHHGAGTDGKLSLERIAEEIRHADIAALQEVDNHFGQRSNFEDQAARLAEMLNMYFVYGANLDLDGSTIREGKIRNLRRQYGTAILSRYPIEFSRNYLLPKIGYTNQSSEQRGLLEAQVGLGDRKLRVYCTHLSNTSTEQRLLQVHAIREIITHASSRGAPQGNQPVASSYVLMGDFNFRPDSEEYRTLTGEFRNGKQLIRADGFVDFWSLVQDTEGYTIGVRGKRGARIDYVFLSPDLVKQAHSASVNKETIASDHQPLTVILGSGTDSSSTQP